MQSFVPVALFLKTLLSQRRLGRASAGGFGCGAVHALLSYHLQRHMEGGCDLPGEVLLSFFYRYGAALNTYADNVLIDDATARTNLYRSSPFLFDKDGTVAADLSNITLLDHGVHLFRACWDMLLAKLRQRSVVGIGDGNTADPAITDLGGVASRSKSASFLRDPCAWTLSTIFVDAELLHNERLKAWEQCRQWVVDTALLGSH